MTCKVVIVGRPNVGKSTLFNRLVGRRLAIVEATPAVTRDRREGHAKLGDLRFGVLDTPGLEEAAPESLEARMRAQTERALENADVVLFVIDARAGVTPLDEHFARWLRKGGPPVVPLANRCEGRGGSDGVLEAYSLGLGDAIPISAAHGEGMADLYEALAPFVKLGGMEPSEDAGLEPEEEAGGAVPDVEETDARPLQLAIVGRPNVGKSTLVNKLLGEERMLTGPEPGMTRESIAIEWRYADKPVRLVDTAGLRRRARVAAQLEKLSVADTLGAIRLAEVVVLVLDATQLMEKQDLAIAKMVLDEGRALVIALNKWDIVEHGGKALSRFRDRLATSLPRARGAPHVTISALTGRRLDQLMEGVFSAYEVWNRRVPTAGLNHWLEEAIRRHPPPVAAGRRLRLRYMTQVKARPPTFVLFASRPAGLPESYLRYLANGLRESFDLPGVPIRLHVRQGKNPFAKKK
jgi:GTP-binding protein